MKADVCRRSTSLDLGDTKIKSYRFKLQTKNVPVLWRVRATETHPRNLNLSMIRVHISCAFVTYMSLKAETVMAHWAVFTAMDLTATFF